jgi:hypothetical protein
LVLSAQSLCPDILGMLNLSQPFGLGADPLAVDLRPRLETLVLSVDEYSGALFGEFPQLLPVPPSADSQR